MRTGLAKLAEVMELGPQTEEKTFVLGLEPKVNI